MVETSRESPELALAGLLAAAPRRRAERSALIRGLAATTPADRVLGAMERFRMVPLLGTRLLEHAPEQVDPALRSHIESATEAAARVGHGFELATRRLCGALEQAGVGVVALKGPALAEALYGSVGMRSAGDIDLLVAPSDVAAACEALAAAGYRLAPGERVDAVGDRHALHVVLVPGPGLDLPPVELHWRLHWLDRALSPHLLALGTPGAQDLARTALVFYARDGFAGLRLGADAAAALERCPQGWEQLVAGTEPALRPAVTAALTVSARLFGSSQAPVRPGAPPRAARLANWPLAGPVAQVQAGVVLVDLLLGPRRRAPAALGRQLGVPRGGGRRAGVLQLLRTVARFPRALWSVRGGRVLASAPGDPYYRGRR